MIVAIATGRALSLLSVTRLRAAGFEMVWGGDSRVLRAARGSTVEVVAELRNRSGEDARGVSLRAIASSMLAAKVEPDTVDLPASSRVFVRVLVRGRRVGHWGVHGLALEVRAIRGGGAGLYEVPLLFANPLGVEVLPRPLARLIDSPAGGRSRRHADAGRAVRSAGDGDELRELRDHGFGDAFKRIAWRASARRGKLLVREFEQERRDLVWLVVAASVELWAGEPGEAPLDAIVDDVSSVAARHLARGDRVGLVLAAARPRAWLSPAAGPAQALKIARALASAAEVLDVDRSGLDEDEIASRVAEHARPLDPAAFGELGARDLDALAERAEALRSRAPFAPDKPLAMTPRDARLRHYLSSFGVEAPPRPEGEGARTAETIAAALGRLAREREKAGLVQIWAPPPGRSATLPPALQRLRRQRTDVRWSLAAAAPPAREAPPETVREAVDAAIGARERLAVVRGTQALRRRGVRVVRTGRMSGDSE